MLEVSPEYKPVFLSSFLTIIGFLIVFQAATESIKKQIHATMSLEASKDIDQFYSEVCDTISAIMSYASLHLMLLNRIKSNESVSGYQAELQFISSQTSLFFERRSQLARLQIKALQFPGKYYSNILVASGNMNKFRYIDEHINNVTDKMWIDIPFIDVLKDNYLALYLSTLEEQRWQDLRDECEKSVAFINNTSQFIKGTLTSPFITFNIAWLIFFIQSRKEIRKSLNLLDKKNTTSN